MKAIRVLVADDHSLVRRGVADVLRRQKWFTPGFTVVGEAKDGREAVAKAKELDPDIILMDLYMPNASGLEATREIKSLRPEARIVFLTISEEDHHLFEAVKAGAQGYLLKDVEPRRLCETLRSVALGDAYVTPSMAGRILEEFVRQGSDREAHAPETLSPREQSVLRLLTRGAANKEIAAALGISVNTVKNHLRHIMQKLHLENRVQVASYAMRQGFVEDPPRR